MDAVISFEGVSFAYGDGARVLDDVSMAVLSGEFIAVVGRNGSGKSTLARHCNGILLPDDGRVLVGGMDTADKEHLLDVRQTVGMVFQNPDNQIVASVVEEDVAFALENLGVPPGEIRHRVDAALRAVDMYDYREHAPHRLSGGQKQRVAIAGVIAMAPRALVLDEPTAMLDPQGRREVLEIVRRLCREEGVAVILITHHMSEAALCDRVVVMDQGRVAAEGSPREIFSDRQWRETGLAVPQAVALLELLRLGGMDIPYGSLTVEECADAIYQALGQGA
ncbi:MAG: energy-coupling factor transporter ATPase [Oscillospiraceae bacterium]|nr:energy-coupling factor transporter ATPase [Oscillospiraceae bacterium]